MFSRHSQMFTDALICSRALFYFHRCFHMFLDALRCSQDVPMISEGYSNVYGEPIGSCVGLVYLVGLVGLLGLVGLVGLDGLVGLLGFGGSEGYGGHGWAGGPCGSDEPNESA